MFIRRREAVEREIARLKSINADTQKANALLALKGLPPLKTGIRAADLLLRQGVRYSDLADICGTELEGDAALCAETQIRYAGYIDKQQRQVDRFASLEKRNLPEDIEYKTIKGLRLEAAHKLAAVRPATLGQAMRISGVSPADISVLAVYLSSRKQ